MQIPDPVRRADIDPELADYSKWPDVMLDILTPKNQAGYKRNRDAVTAFLDGKSHVYITSHTKVSPQRVRVLLKRCLTTHLDTRIWGFRALVPNVHVATYIRVKPLPDPKQGDQGNFAGAFKQFLSAHPEIEKLLKNLYFNRARASGLGQEVRIPIKSAHKRFKDACRKEGLTSKDYPLNTKSEGREAMRRYFGGLNDENVISAIVARGDVEASVAMANAGTPALDIEPLAPYEATEFDGHTVDLQVNMDMDIELWLPTPSGVETSVILERMTLLLMVDVASEANLAYQTVLHAHYNSTHVLLCMQHFLDRWEPMELTIPGLCYLPGAGLPSGVIPECAGAGICMLRWDNHRVHLSKLVYERVGRALRCTLNWGKHKTPLAREMIERTFGILEQELHRLQGTTGSYPTDPLRKKQRGKKTLLLRESEFYQLLDVILANQNVTPHARGFGMSPNEMIRAAIDQGRILLHQVQASDDQASTLLYITLTVTVRGSLKKGVRSHINYLYARYWNAELAARPGLIGEKVTIVVNRTDLRRVRAYLKTGESLGVLTVENLWASTPHTLEQRVMIQELIRKKKLNLSDHPDPIHAAVDFMAQSARKSRRAASTFVDLVKQSKRREGESVNPNTTNAPGACIPGNRTEQQSRYWKPRQHNWIHLK